MLTFLGERGGEPAGEPDTEANLRGKGTRGQSKSLQGTEHGGRPLGWPGAQTAYQLTGELDTEADLRGAAWTPRQPK